MVWTLVLAALVLAVALGISTVQIAASRNEAEQARKLAEDKSILLEEQRDLARRKESVARQLVYASDVRLAAQAWEDGDVRHYVDLLDRHAQATSNEDLRGFEWRYLRQLGMANSHTIAAGAAGVCSVRYSPDGRFLASFAGHDDHILDVAFHPNGTMLASCDYGGVIRTWHLGNLAAAADAGEHENWPARFHGPAARAWSCSCRWQQR